MAETQYHPVKSLKLDLRNRRTRRQPDEQAALRSMVRSSPDRFIALAQSLLNDGYLPTENVIVIKSGAKLIVKEGNRRIAALKLLHGYLVLDDNEMPEDLRVAVAKVTPEWKAATATVPCTIYEAKDKSTVDRIVNLIHGKGLLAGRESWNTIARARHNRDVQDASEPGLDLLEKYFEHGRNLSAEKRDLWSSHYPVTVLDEAMKRLAPRLNFPSAPALAASYPKVPHRDGVEGIILAIGMGILKFASIRAANFGEAYGLPPLPPDPPPPPPPGKPGSSKPTSTGPTTKPTSAKPTKPTTPAQKPAVSMLDPKAVKIALTAFTPMGNGRAKLVTMRDEALSLNIEKTPLAFCFVLRCMFELSGKAYCADHAKSNGPTAKKSDGNDKHLVDLLRDVKDHIIATAGGPPEQRAMKNLLHGPMAELATQNGLLSVTSLNQLVHNPHFLINSHDIAKTFGNVYPLLEKMNA